MPLLTYRMKGLLWTYGSRAFESPLWPQVAGGHGDHGRKLKAHILRGQHETERDRNGRLSKPSPMTYFPQQSHTSHTSKRTSTNWGAGAQTTESMVDILIQASTECRLPDTRQENRGLAWWGSRPENSETEVHGFR